MQGTGNAGKKGPQNNLPCTYVWGSWRKDKPVNDHPGTGRESLPGTTRGTLMKQGALTQTDPDVLISREICRSW